MLSIILSKAIETEFTTFSSGPKSPSVPGTKGDCWTESDRK